MLLIGLIGVVMYFVCLGFSAKIMQIITQADDLSKPDCWFFSIFWPLTLPAVLGYYWLENRMMRSRK